MAQTKKFKSKVRAIGNSKGLIIPGYVCKYDNIEEGSEIQVIIETTKADLYSYWLHENTEKTGGLTG